MYNKHVALTMQLKISQKSFGYCNNPSQVLDNIIMIMHAQITAICKYIIYLCFCPLYKEHQVLNFDQHANQYTFQRHPSDLLSGEN